MGKTNKEIVFLTLPLLLLENTNSEISLMGNFEEKGAWNGDAEDSPPSYFSNRREQRTQRESFSWGLKREKKNSPHEHTDTNKKKIVEINKGKN